jgi:hypothetical protein
VVGVEQHLSQRLDVHGVPSDSATASEGVSAPRLTGCGTTTRLVSSEAGLLVWDSSSNRSSARTSEVCGSCRNVTVVRSSATTETVSAPYMPVPTRSAYQERLASVVSVAGVPNKLTIAVTCREPPRCRDVTDHHAVRGRPGALPS